MKKALKKKFNGFEIFIKVKKFKKMNFREKNVFIVLKLNSLRPSFSISRPLEAHLLTRSMSCLKFNSLMARWSSTKNGNSSLMPSLANALMKVLNLPTNDILSDVLSSVNDRFLSFVMKDGIEAMVDTKLLLLVS